MAKTTKTSKIKETLAEKIVRLEAINNPSKIEKMELEVAQAKKIINEARAEIAKIPKGKERTSEDKARLREFRRVISEAQSSYTIANTSLVRLRGANRVSEIRRSLKRHDADDLKRNLSENGITRENELKEILRIATEYKKLIVNNLEKIGLDNLTSITITITKQDYPIFFSLPIQNKTEDIKEDNEDDEEEEIEI